jgi:hypothetical protein
MIVETSSFNSLVKQALTKSILSKYSQVTSDFSNAVGVSTRLYLLVGTDIRHFESQEILFVRIIRLAITSYFDCEGCLKKKYAAFVRSIFKSLPVLLEYGVSNSDLEEGEYSYWDFVKEGYINWANQCANKRPKVKKVQVVWDNSYRDSVSLLIISKVLDRNDLTFLGLPHAGKATLFSGEQGYMSVENNESVIHSC